MRRSILVRLAGLTAGVAIVASCDTRVSTSPIVTGSTGGTGSSSNTGGKGPTVTIDTPTVNSLANIGDSILVVMRLHDDKALKTASVVGLKLTGSADLGTLTQTVRYPAITIPATGVFRAGLRDTVIRRYLKPSTAGDTTVDSLVIAAIATDSAGITDTTKRRIDLVAGPRVILSAPASGDSTPAGIGLTAIATADHPDGISNVKIRFQGEVSWPTKFDTTISQSIIGAPRSVTVSGIARVPIDAPVRGRVTVTATASSVTGRPSNMPVAVVYVRAASAAQPVVNQNVDARLELTDSVSITARGDGIRAIGLVARDGSGAVVMRDSVLLPQPFAGNATALISLSRIPTSYRGRRVAITGFAVDQSNRTGYAVRSGQLAPIGTLGSAFVDSTLIVFGHTFPLPSSRSAGLVGDLVWDAPRENVILSNQSYNRLEVFHAQTSTYEANGVAVGSFPWGLFVANDPGNLWVANSGGTNLSRVDLAGLQEVQRIRTRITPLFTLTEDAAKGDSINPVVWHESVSLPVLYSDRPQYLGQLKDGTIYFSTQPTATAPKGSIRYLDPSFPFPDTRPVIIYKSVSASIKTVVIRNADNVITRSGAPNSDFITICDHTPDTNNESVCVESNKGLQAAIADLKAKIGSTDIEAVGGVDITDAGLTDTTFVAVSGDRNWVAFGSGHTAGAGNLFMANASGFMSAPIQQTDLTNNASEHINGLALDKSGFTVGAHGDNSFFSSVDYPFHLRLQGLYPNAAPGQGIAFHPNADFVSSPSAGGIERTGYVASGNQSIEVLDIFHYLGRGTIPIKTNLYGPLRAALPPASDAAQGVVLKLFGVSKAGLVVIDLRASDILPSP